MQKFSLTWDVCLRRDVEHAAHGIQFGVSVENDKTSFFEMRLTLYYQLRSDCGEGFHFADAKMTFTIDVHYHRESVILADLLDNSYRRLLVKRVARGGKFIIRTSRYSHPTSVLQFCRLFLSSQEWFFHVRHYQRQISAVCSPNRAWLEHRQRFEQLHRNCVCFVQRVFCHRTENNQFLQNHSELM